MVAELQGDLVYYSYSVASN